MPERENRLIRVFATFDLLLDLMTEGNTVDHLTTIEGLPRDAKFIRDYFDYSTGQVCFVFSHPSFSEVFEGEVIPVRRIVFKKEYPHAVMA